MEEQKQLNKEKKSDSRYWLFALRITGDYLFTIAAPVVILAYAGKRLDLYFQSGYKLTVAGFVLAALISAKIIYKKSVKYGKEYQDL